MRDVYLEGLVQLAEFQRCPGRKVRDVSRVVGKGPLDGLDDRIFSPDARIRSYQGSGFGLGNDRPSPLNGRGVPHELSDLHTV